MGDTTVPPHVHSAALIPSEKAEPASLLPGNTPAAEHSLEAGRGPLQGCSEPARRGKVETNEEQSGMLCGCGTSLRTEVFDGVVSDLRF